jgi:glycosyltransferase involved in cell wall biosynthesis
LIIIGSNIGIYKQDEITKNAKIEFYENISDHALSQWYKRAQFFVSMSSYEGFGLPVLEALFYNCCVICSNIEVYNELYNQHVYFCEIENNELLQLFNNLSYLPLLKIDMSALIQKYNYEKSAQYIYTLLNTK